MIEIAVEGILIPFIGTAIGAAMVFLLKNKISELIQKILVGFAAGVMIAASVWSLLIPSIEMSQSQGVISWIPASIGFLLGIIILMVIDEKVKKMEENRSNNSNIKQLETHSAKKIIRPTGRTLMLALAVTLHNIPEGMAVGVIFAGLLSKQAGITVAGAIALSVGIGIQNIPEGAIISMPLKSEGMSKIRSFIYGALSGIVEPIGAIITVLLTRIILPILSYLLSFAAGAMIYVVVEELIPQIQIGKYKNIGIISLAIGFILMMVLDVALG